MKGVVSRIEREPAAAAGRIWDVIVVGGGIYGAFVALESAGRGLRTLLLERDDFGSGTSGNSLRIAHGGLRYLQSVDLARFRRSIRERHWLRAAFPHLVEELGCLMPLYGEGLRRGSLMRMALSLNDMAVAGAAGQAESWGRWPPSRLLDVRTTRQVFPSVPADGLQGAAFWYDGFIRSTPRLLIEVIRWSCSLGAVALNYTECVEVRVRRGQVQGVRAVDRTNGRDLTFQAPVVVNAAGASVRRLAAMAGGDVPELFHPTLAFNLLLRKEPLSAQALAVTPRTSGGPTSFLLPWNGRTLAGTRHERWDSSAGPPVPGEAEIIGFLDDLNRGAPGLEATMADVVRVYAGLLPGNEEGARMPRRRPLVIDHGARGEVSGLFSISGVKYTTARRVADRTVRKVQERNRERGFRHFRRAITTPPPLLPDSVRAVVGDTPAELLSRDRVEVAGALEEIVAGEAVVHLDDLMLRRTDWGADPVEGSDVADLVVSLLEGLPGWDRARCARERARLDLHWDTRILGENGTRTIGPAA